MKLTNYIRDAFISSVMNDVPKHDFHEDYRKVFLDAHCSALPQEVQALWASSATRPYLNTSSVSACGSSFAVPSNDRYSSVSTPEKVKDKLDAIESKYKAQRNVREALRSSAKSAAYACTTIKQLRELLPEFDRYLPAEEEKTLRTLPVIQNTVAEFVKAGWPTKKAPK